jgi:hypothetical protein
MQDGNSLEHSQTGKLKVLKRIASQRSISAPLEGTRQGESPYQGGSGKAWNRLGLYLKGLPPNALKKQQKGQKRHTISDEIVSSTSNELFSLKTDNETLETRLTLQERQYKIALANIEEEMKKTCRGLDLLREDNCEAALHMDQHLGVLQEKIGKLIKRSEDYGKLRYEEKVSKMLDTFDIYAASLHHGRESISREIKELNDNIDDEKLLNELNRIQDQEEYNADEILNVNSEWQTIQDYKKPERDMGSSRTVSLVVQELKQRKLSNNNQMDPRMNSENTEDSPEDTASVNMVQKWWKDFVENTVATLKGVDGQKLFRLFRFAVALVLVIAAFVILLWPVFN